MGITEKANSIKAKVKPVDRRQMVMRTVDVEELISADHPARTIWEFVKGQNLEGFYKQIKSLEGEVGRPGWDPHMMISIWIYSYSEGISSAREIARMCEYDPVYQWLTGLQVINHHSLSDFRIDNGEALKELFVEVLGVLSAEGLVTMRRVMHDGTKVKASASGSSFRREGRLKQHLRLAEEQVRKMEESGEQEVSSRVKKAQERAAREKKERVEKALKELEKVRAGKSAKEKEEVRASESEPDARRMRHADGAFAASYNLQITTDAENKMIVGFRIGQSSSDFEELVESIEKVRDNTGEKPSQVVVDGGFVSGDNIVAMSEEEIELIGPVPDNTARTAGLKAALKAKIEYGLDCFNYDQASDTYSCPAGADLNYYSKEVSNGHIRYVYRASYSSCQGCAYKQKCCPGNQKSGRSITRSEPLPEMKKFLDRMATEEMKKIYKQRSAVAEYPNMWLKEKFNLRRFRVRGLLKVEMEAMWACLTYNIKQLICLKRQLLTVA